MDMDLGSLFQSDQSGADFDTRQIQLARQRALLDKLRDKDISSIPAGQMVGKFYVPNRGAQIVPAMGSIASSFMQPMMDKKEGQLRQDTQNAASQWLAQQPQAQQVEEPGMGPPTAEGVEPPPTMKTVQPTSREQLAWAQQGQTNPLTRALAAHYAQDQLVQAPIRQEARANRVEDREDNQQARHDALVANLNLKHDQIEEQRRQFEIRAGDNLISEENRQQARETANELRRQGLGIQRELADAKIQHDKDMLELKKTGNNAASKPMGLTDLLKLQGLASKVESTARFRDTFQDKFAGPTAGISRLGGTYIPGAGANAKATAGYWNDYAAHANVVRHELFGSALTLGEKEEWDKSDIFPTMDPKLIRTNLARRAMLEQKAYDKLEGAASAGTRGEQLNAIRPQLNTQPSNMPAARGMPAMRGMPPPLPPGVKVEVVD